MNYERILWNVSLALWLAVNSVVILLSLLPIRQAVFSVSNADKLSHLLAYAALGAITYSTISLHPGMKDRSWPMRALLVLLYCALIGGAIEILQPYVGRGCEFLDFVADITGALLGTLAASIGLFAVRRWITCKR
jgi:VanZ family protein